jgi:hypothetical protein
MSLMTPGRIVGEPTLAAISSFNSYVSAVEARIDQQHRSEGAFFPLAAPASLSEQRLRRER